MGSLAVILAIAAGIVLAVLFFAALPYLWVCLWILFWLGVVTAAIVLVWNYPALLLVGLVPLTFWAMNDRWPTSSSPPR